VLYHALIKFTGPVYGETETEFDTMCVKHSGSDHLHFNTSRWVEVHLGPIGPDEAMLNVEGNRFSQSSVEAILAALQNTSRTNVLILCHRDSRHQDLVALLRRCERHRLHSMVSSE
jgi:hypothetical protein